ncbi:TonB-dependent receptor plug domain-containing protein [Rufibacter psychrotolerans]|uniref:TonB-dependent receptor plug domain-containing protein n=1 Tax=Rufibacter psychrotolerans TaxID=2812556 RepID=UPI001967EA07|nr:TonB-dependent receptor plug domain-containing protein [Rufibacter sp. SYSU D00308]
MSVTPTLRFALFSLGLFLMCAFGPKQWLQDGVLQKIIAQLQQFGKSYPQEKVYLHLDKPYYAAGEDVWFKAYLVDAATHAPSPISKVLYVDLVTPEDSIYRRVVVNMENGMGRGDLALEDTIPEGQYRLRAYTSWMQNFDEAYFFHQNVRVFNPRLADLVPSVHFSFKRYGAGDSVWADVALRNLKEEPLAQWPVAFHTRMGKKISARRKAITSKEGKARYAFFLPTGEARQPAQLWLSLKEGKTEMQRHFQIPQASEQVELEFFPEGGELVQNMWSVVGFKAVDANGLGKDVQGHVVDDTGRKVADFKSLKFGMGRFGFLPQPGKRYVALLQNPNGSQTQYPLPAARAKGVVMRVDNSKPDAVQIRAYLVGYAGAEDRPASLSMVAQSRGTVYFTGHTAAAKDLIQMSVPRHKLPTGVVQFTLFSHTGDPLAERLVFVNRQDQLQLTLTPDKPSYKPREKVTMHLQAHNAEGTPVSGHFSVAVTDARKVTPEPYAPSILSTLLLTSDLRGHIEQPGYYFSPEPEAPEALDNLMLTQGWRRFVWKDLLQEKPLALPFPVERGMAVTGTVQRPSGKPEANAIVTLISLRAPGMLLLDTTDAQGRFAFGLATLDDSAHVVVQARTAKGKDWLEVLLDKGVPVPPVSRQAPAHVPPALLSQSTWAYLRNNREQLRLDQLAGKSVLLSSVEIRAKKIRTEEQELRQGQLYQEPDHSLKASTLPPAMDLISALQGRVAGVMVVGGQVSMRGSGPPLYLLDGMPVEVELIKGISLTEVEAIDIIKPGPMATIFGSRGNGGVISVILKRGGTSAPASTRYRGIAAYRGVRLQRAREFYMPQHQRAAEAELPDLRTTLYWSPIVTTDARGQASFSFYCADPQTTYQAVVEGLTAQGQLGRATTQLQVR